MCYLDDILIFLKNTKKHEEHVKLVLQKLGDVGLCSKLEKYDFHQPQVKFIRYIIFNKGLLIDLKKIQTISNWSIL